MSGTLYLCATPIGNLEDITIRALRILKEADIIAAEDTRNSQKLLRHYDIHTALTSYHEHNKWDKGRTLIAKLEEGQNVVLISDAGMPGISDPGYELVKMAHDANITVSVLPGATASLSALTISGLPTRYFSFEGFLPVDNKQRRERLEELVKEERTMILYEAPHKLKRTLCDLTEKLGESRECALVRELTKKHETVERGTLGELKEIYEEKEPRGEYVIVVHGAEKAQNDEAERKKWEELSISEHYELYIAAGMERQEAMKRVAFDRGSTKREIYNEIVKNKQSKE